MNSDLQELLVHELAGHWPSYEQGLLHRKTEKFCDDCILVQKAKAEGAFYPTCYRSTDEHAESLVKDQPPEQHELLRTVVDPVYWAKFEFGWDARFYQSQMLRCSAQHQAWRLGRRLGKTTALAIKALYLCATKPGVKANDPYTVLIITPYETQLDHIFDICRGFISKGRTLKTSHDLKHPATLELPNGSLIKGYTAGEKAGSRSTKIRGQDANAILLDEMDYLRDDDLAAVLAIMASHSECLVIFSSTPRGEQTRFRSVCEDPRLGFREFWFATHESPEYSIKTDHFYRAMATRHEYEHEYLALFSRAADAIFPEDQIRTSIRSYPLGGPAEPTEQVVIGVDWNAAANGVHTVVLGLTSPPKISARVIDVQILQGTEFTHPKAQRMVLDLYLKWRPRLLALDRGYAHSQIEELAEWALLHPEYGLDQALVHYDMGSSYHYNDPISGEEIRRPMKPLMVGVTQRLLGSGALLLPTSQETESGIVGQMRKFQLKAVGTSGRPIYTQGNEHTLTAMMVAAMAWILEVVGFEPFLSDGVMTAHAETTVPRELRLRGSMVDPLIAAPADAYLRSLVPLIKRAQVTRQSSSRGNWLGESSPREPGKTMRKMF